LKIITIFAYWKRCVVAQIGIDLSKKENMPVVKYDNVDMDVLSMGMSGDYVAAVKNGATIVRIGRTLFN
jgi:uncharacterized pyridoxal phosphate-containing UPF0001 family protein